MWSMSCTFMYSRLKNEKKTPHTLCQNQQPRGQFKLRASCYLAIFSYAHILTFVFHSAAAAGLRPYSETGPRPHTSLYPVVSEGTWLEKNNYAQFDGWELRQLINFVAVSLLIAICLYELWFFCVWNFNYKTWKYLFCDWGSCCL